MILDRLKAFFDAGGRVTPAPLLDRRADPRRTVLLKAMVLPVASYAALRIVNASRTGFGGETIASLQAGQPLIFSVEGHRFHQGTVRWTRGQKFGVDLDDAFAILGCSPEVDPGFLPAHTARPRRYPIERAGRIVMGWLTHQATVRDISQSGMRLELEAELGVGQQVIVRLPDHRLILATVRWCANQIAGVETAERIQTLRLVYGSA